MGAMIGVPVFLIGSLLGIMIGAFLGAFIVELFIKKDMKKAFRAGTGVFLGHIGGIFVKELLGIVMFAMILGQML